MNKAAYRHYNPLPPHPKKQKNPTPNTKQCALPEEPERYFYPAPQCQYRSGASAGHFRVFI